MAEPPDLMAALRRSVEEANARRADELAAARRKRKAQDDGSCPECGRYRVACSPYGRPCMYRADLRDGAR